MSTANAKGPFKLVTVNTVPERAKRVVGRVADELQDRYIIQHVANCEGIDQVAEEVQNQQPDVLFCASMWTAEEGQKIQSIARQVKPNIATYAIPTGLHLDGGPDAIVEHLCERVPELLDGIKQS